MTLLRCYTCLQSNRKLSPLKVEGKFIFAFLCPEMFIRIKDNAQFQICWECQFMVDKIKRFQNKLKEAHEILKLSLKGQTTVIEGLSCLTTTSVTTITITIPNLPQNVPIPSQNERILPKIELNVPQNVLEPSSKDMLEIPIKMENIEDETVSNDFEDLIQPKAILTNPIEKLDPLLTQPAQIEVSPPNPIKTEIVDPAINHIPQKVFTNPPKHEIKPRGLRETVKVTTGINKDMVPTTSNKSDQLLKNILSTPSKLEEMLFQRQDVPCSPVCHNSLDGQTESNTLSEDDEAVLITLDRTEVDAYREKKRSKPMYQGSAYKCETCIEHFRSQDKLDHHNMIHDTLRGNSICDICEQRFPDNSLRDEHYKQHFIIYGCRNCPARYLNRVQLKNHCLRKHEESAFLCRICFVFFKTFEERSRHIIQTHSQRSRCEECDKTFASAYQLKTHVLNTHKAKPVKCTICKKMVKKNSLKNHMRIHDETIERIYCPDCDTSYKSKILYECHLKTSLKHNTIEKLGFKCNHCDKYFKNIYSLKIHIEEIGGVKYTCDVCKKDFKSKRNLIGHIKSIHEGKKRKTSGILQICDICGTSCKNKKILREHMNRHLGIRPFICKECGATFTHSGALFTHRRLKHKVKRKKDIIADSSGTK